MSKKIIKILIIILVIFVVWGLSRLYVAVTKNSEQIYGVSFNAPYAKQLGLEPNVVLETILNDWGFHYVRLSAQWDEIEKSPGVYNFAELNSQMDLAEKYNAKVALVVGQKTPRWPECHAPKWAEKLSDVEYEAAIKRFVKSTVEQYVDHPAMEIWQIENEPLLKYGDDVCRFFDMEMLISEINIVRSFDSARPIMVTDSGELSSWRNTARAGDLFGTTMYRVVWNKTIGYFSYDWLTPLFYRFKLWLTGQKMENTYISELQAEPWVAQKDITKVDLDEQYKSMNIKRFQKNIDYAQKVGFSRAYLWGAEWWYWMEQKKNISDFADYVKILKKK
jgi:hypothetical protein